MTKTPGMVLSRGMISVQAAEMFPGAHPRICDTAEILQIHFLFLSSPVARWQGGKVARWQKLLYRFENNKYNCGNPG
jgi:hypothetical protein